MPQKNYFIGLLVLIVGGLSAQMNPLYFNEYLSENYYNIHPAMAGSFDWIEIDLAPANMDDSAKTSTILA